MPDPKKRIRVAHIITNFSVGGAQDYLLLIVRGLDQKKFDPIIAGSMQGEWISAAKAIKGTTVLNIPSLCRPISPLRDLRAMFEVKRLCREHKIDILHTHSSKPGVVARIGGFLAGVPAIVHTIHGFSFHDFMPRWQRRMFIFIEQWMSRFTTTLLLYSHADRIRADEHGISAVRSVENFYYGIDYTPFRRKTNRVKIRRAFGFGRKEFIIGFTGRLSRQKGLHILVRAFAAVHRHLPQTRLLLIGDGPLRSELQNEIKGNNLENVATITGFRSDIPELLPALDLFVMTSLWEGLSRSLAEALYAQLPVVATDVGGTSDAIRNGETGWLIPPNDVAAAAAAIEEAVGKPGLARKIAERGYRWARKAFDVKAMNKKIEQLYIGLMRINV